MDGSIAAVERLARALSGPDRPVQELAAELGTVEADDGGSVRIRPADPAFSRATIVRAPEGGLNHVELTLAEPLSVDALREAFGDYSTPPKIHWDSPSRVIFRIDEHGLPYRCALIARIDDGAVGELTLRRDERLD